MDKQPKIWVIVFYHVVLSFVFSLGAYFLFIGSEPPTGPNSWINYAGLSVAIYFIMRVSSALSIWANAPQIFRYPDFLLPIQRIKVQILKGPNAGKLFYHYYSSNMPDSELMRMSKKEPPKDGGFEIVHVQTIGIQLLKCIKLRWGR